MLLQSHKIIKFYVWVIDMGNAQRFQKDIYVRSDVMGNLSNIIQFTYYHVHFMRVLSVDCVYDYHDRVLFFTCLLFCLTRPLSKIEIRRDS